LRSKKDHFKHLANLLKAKYEERMPVKSKAQAGFMGLVASGKIKKKGLSKATAREFLKGVKVKKLPKRKKK